MSNKVSQRLTASAALPFDQHDRRQTIVNAVAHPREEGRNNLNGLLNAPHLNKVVSQFLGAKDVEPFRQIDAQPAKIKSVYRVSHWLEGMIAEQKTFL
jgi:hypothetical protein